MDYLPDLSERDKTMHAAAGACAGALTAAVAPYIIPSDAPRWVRPGLILLSGMAAGVAKEVYDNQHPDTHTVEASDAVATALGSVPVALAFSFDF